MTIERADDDVEAIIARIKTDAGNVYHYHAKSRDELIIDGLAAEVRRLHEALSVALQVLEGLLK